MDEDDSLLAVAAHRWLNDVSVARGLLVEVRQRLEDGGSEDPELTALVKDCDDKLLRVITDLRDRATTRMPDPRAGVDRIIDLDDQPAPNPPPSTR